MATSRTAARTRAFWRGPFRPAHPVERRRLAAGVGSDRVDLVGREVELVTAAVLELQVVPLGAADRPRHHAGEAGDSVNVVDDVVSRGQVVEETFRRAGSRPRLAVRPPPAGHVRLGHDGELRGQDEGSAIHRCDDDVDARAADLDVDLGWWLVDEQTAGEALAVEHGRHALGAAAAVGADDHPVAGTGELAEASGEAGGVAEHRRPARGLERHRPGAPGNGEHRRELGACALQEPVESEVQPGHPGGGVGRLESPRRRQALGERHLLVEDLGGTVTQPPGLEEHDPGALVEEIREQMLFGAQPRQPRLHAVEQLSVGDPGEVVPSERRLDRRDAARARAPPSVSTTSRQPKISTCSRSAIERWSATSKAVSLSTSSPKRSMRIPWFAVEGNTSTMPPRTASSPRCFDLVLTPVAGVDEACHEILGIDLRSLRGR